jgi:parvulin-like peptidyl-prolyl isomerase
LRPWILIAISSLIAAGAARCALAATSLADPDTPTWSDVSRKPSPELPPVASSGTDRRIATIDNNAITLDQLERPLLEAYGLQFLLHVARNQHYVQKAREAGITTTPADMQAERNRMLEQIFGASLPLDNYPGTDAQKQDARKAEMERLLPQVLESQKVTTVEFDFAIRNGALLWKIAEQQIVPRITEDDLQKVFRVQYGEKARVRHIELRTLPEVAEVQRRLAAGEDFAKLASELSLDKDSRPYGGELRAFSRAEPTLSEAFKEAAFLLQEGEVSSPVNTGESFHLIKLEQRIAPQVIKYEDVKESVRQQLANILISLKVQALRQTFDAEAAGLLQIDDPGLRARFRQMMDRAAAQGGQDPASVRRQIGRDNQPSDLSSPPGSEVARPPATRPGP